MTALTAYWVGHAYPPAIRDLKDLETVLLPLIAFTIFFTAYLSMIFSGLIFRELVVCSIRTESEETIAIFKGGFVKIPSQSGPLFGPILQAAIAPEVGESENPLSIGASIRTNIDGSYFARVNDGENPLSIGASIRTN